MNTVRKDQTSEKKKKLQPTFSRKIPPDTPKYTRKVELHSTKLFLIALFPLASGDVTVAPPSSFSEFIYPLIAPETDFVPAAGNFTDNFAKRSVYRTYIIILSLHQLWFDLRTTEVWTFQSPTTPTCFANSAVVYFWLFPLLRETVIPRFFFVPLPSWRASYRTYIRSVYSTPHAPSWTHDFWGFSKYLSKCIYT